MEATMSVEDVRQVAWVVRQLQPISRKLHRIDEANCNYGNTTRRDKAEVRLMKDAEEYAQRLGLHAYHQGDPRGASLYLIDESMNDTNYSNGVCIQ